MPSTDDQNSDLYALRKRLNECETAYEQRLKNIEKALEQVANAGAIENILCNGFATVSAQLEPLRELRDLTQQRELMDKDQDARLRNLRKSLERPNWTNANTLKIKEPDAPFIGAAALPEPRADGTQDYAQVGRAAS